MSLPPAPAVSVPPPPPASTIPTIEASIASAFSKPPPTPPVPAKSESAKPAPAPAPEAAKSESAKPAPTLLPKKAAPATPPPAAAPEPDPFEKFSLPDTAPEEQRSQFTELKRVSREQHKRLKEMEAKLAAPTMPAPEVEKLRSEHKAALDRLALLDLKSHPDFRRQFEEPRTKALAEVAEVLAFNGKEGVDLSGLLSKDRKAFSAEVVKLTEGLNPMDATSVQTALRDAYRIAGEEKAALAKSGELSQQMQQRAEAHARQVFEEVSNNLGPMGDFLVTLDAPEGATPEELEEVNTYNQAVHSIRQNVEKTVFGRTDERGMAQLGWKGATLDFLLQHGIPRMERTFSTLVAERDALAKELSAVKAAKGSGPIAGDPGKGGSTAPTTDQMIAQTFARR